MCGIVGFWNAGGGLPSDATCVERMAHRIRARGPDDKGVYCEASSGLALAHRRLSIIDLSHSGHQPMQSVCGRFVIVFNGEVYNFQLLRKQLEAEGVSGWRGHSDTEVLLQAIAQWGLKIALQRSVGMFALAVWDKKERSLSLARDRLGEKPLYYGHLSKSFVFASELKALHAHPEWQGTIDRNALTLLMRHNCIPAPYTIIKGLHKVEPGQILKFRSADDASPQSEIYWDARETAIIGQENPFAGDAEEAVESLEELIRQSLTGQMIADVPLGAFLSGGVDSSAVVALMQAMSDRPVQTFTIGFQSHDFNEALHAKAVSKHLGTEHTELYVTEQQARDVIPNLSSIYCEPFSDSSQIPTYLVAQLARDSVAVALSGDGGDELFSGYRRYGLSEGLWRKISRIPHAVRRVAGYGTTQLPPRVIDSLAWRLKRLVPGDWQPQQFGDRVHKAASLLGCKTQEDVYLKMVSHWTTPEELVLNSHEPASKLLDIINAGGDDDHVKRMMLADLISYLPDDILVKVDRAAMSVSLETRVPLLDHRIVEFSQSLPLSILRKDGQSKWPLRQILYKFVPKDLIERPKMGFGVPISGWLRGELRGWAEELLDEKRLAEQGLFDPKPIRNAWNLHVSGRRNMQYLLWDVLMFQAWYDAQKGVSNVLNMAPRLSEARH